jgi:hypothetical protein
MDAYLTEPGNTAIAPRPRLYTTGFAIAFTPKELRLIAQGCERSELPWDKIPPLLYPERVLSPRKIWHDRHGIEYDVRYLGQ